MMLILRISGTKPYLELAQLIEFGFDYGEPDNDLTAECFDQPTPMCACLKCLIRLELEIYWVLPLE